MAEVSGEHSLRSLNEAERRAMCATCGPVKIFRSGSGWRCSVAHAEYKRKKRAEDKEKRLLTTALRVKTICCKVPFEIPPINPSYTFGDGVVRMEFAVRCRCGVWHGISRRHMMREGVDYLLWVEAEQVYENGLHRHTTRPEDDGYEVMESIDLLAAHGPFDGELTDAPAGMGRSAKAGKALAGAS